MKNSFKEYLIQEYLVNIKDYLVNKKTYIVNIKDYLTNKKEYLVNIKEHLVNKKVIKDLTNLAKSLHSTINKKKYEPYPKEFNEEIKEKIRKRDNYTCQVCDMTEEEHLIVFGRVLEVHHIDYNKKNCKEENLVTTCKQCNIRANYNREYWKNYFKV